MRLYHRTNLIFCLSILLASLGVVLAGCSPSQATQAQITVNITADGNEYAEVLDAGSTVEQALGSAGITLGELDRVEPGLPLTLSAGAQVKVTRVRQEFYTDQVIIPFEHQELKNEALPAGEKRLSQPGASGLEERTYRRVFEDEVQISASLVKTTVLQEAVPEIEMVGIRALSAAIQLPGKLAYLSAGNAWVMQNNTADRKLVVSSGDLDGRVFSLSRDGKYLLFTRHSSSEYTINTLWLASLENDPVQITNLEVANVVHFAQFDPTSSQVAYSTVEWREASPGWQASNDLLELEIHADGSPGSTTQVLPPGIGGVYGWWGTDYSWSPDGQRLLYARPDGVGIIDERRETQVSLLDITPYQTNGNWAWVPGAAWSPDGATIYAVGYAISATLSSAGAQHFDLVAIPAEGGSPTSLVSNVGMFAHPVPSPAGVFAGSINQESSSSSEQAQFTLAYLHAIDPSAGETSLYRLFTIHADGSNPQAIFPPDGDEGLTPQEVAWSPEILGDEGDYAIALVYNGNIWIIDSGTGIAQQITGDGLTTRVDWR